ncbi:MAG: DNA-binding protein [Planctomycetota bacterium]
MVNGVPFIDFDRTAPSLAKAVLSAIHDVARSGTGARVVRIEPGDLVNASEIARRLGRTRESVRLLIRGTRGPGGFPPPVADLRTRSPVWSWAAVAHWVVANGISQNVGLEQARFIAAANTALSLARHAAPGDLVEALADLQARPSRSTLRNCVAIANEPRGR